MSRKVSKRYAAADYNAVNISCTSFLTYYRSSPTNGVLQAYEHVEHAPFAIAVNEEESEVFLGMRYMVQVGHLWGWFPKSNLLRLTSDYLFTFDYMRITYLHDTTVLIYRS